MADPGPARPARINDAHLREKLMAAAHELRSPLNAILAWAQVLEQSLQERPPPVERALSGIRDGVARQVSLIDQLLETSGRNPGGTP